jgi:hypothetical protein
VPISVTATSPAAIGTVVHSTGISSIDEIWLYATNTSSSSLLLTIQYGGITATNQIQQTIPSNAGLTLILPGLILAPLGSSITVSAYASTSAVINVSGYVNRIA